MSAMRLVLGVLLASLSLSASAAAQEITPAMLDSAAQVSADSLRRATFQRARRLVTDGQGAEGRALIDSLLNSTEPGSTIEADVLYWRAALAESWDAAQRDYLRITLEHARTPRAGAALLRLAQGELARGDRDAALGYLERIEREVPVSPVRGEAGLWQGRLLMEKGDRAAGCAALRAARAQVSSGAIELENQYDFLLRGCEANTAVAAAPSSANPPSPRAPSAAEDSAMAPRPTRASTTLWTVQIAAFPSAAEARKFADEVRGRGYDTRVDGTSAPFRVRFGRYESRDAAVAAMNAYKEKERSDAFLAQVPRE